MEYDPTALEDVAPCDPLTTEPKVTQATDPWGTRMDAEMIVVDVSDDPVPREVVLEGGYGFGYSRADGADTQDQRDQLRGSGYQVVHYSDEERDAYDVGLIPTVEVPGYREMVVWRDARVPDESNPDYVDVFNAVCGTVGFTVGGDGSLSDAHLVDNPDAGTFEYAGQLR